MFINASATGGNVSIPGKLDSQCLTVTFHTLLSGHFQAISPGVYWVQVKLSTLPRFVSFALKATPIGLGAGSSNSSLNMVLSNAVSE